MRAKSRGTAYVLKKYAKQQQSMLKYVFVYNRTQKCITNFITQLYSKL